MALNRYVTKEYANRIVVILTCVQLIFRHISAYVWDRRTASHQRMLFIRGLELQ